MIPAIRAAGIRAVDPVHTGRDRAVCWLPGFAARPGSSFDLLSYRQPLPNRLVRHDVGRHPMLDDAALLHYVAGMTNRRGAADILLNEEQRDALVPHPRQRRENLRHHPRSEALRRL